MNIHCVRRRCKYLAVCISQGRNFFLENVYRCRECKRLFRLFDPLIDKRLDDTPCVSNSFRGLEHFVCEECGGKR